MLQSLRCSLVFRHFYHLNDHIFGPLASVALPIVTPVTEVREEATAYCDRIKARVSLLVDKLGGFHGTISTQAQIFMKIWRFLRGKHFDMEVC